MTDLYSVHQGSNPCGSTKLIMKEIPEHPEYLVTEDGKVFSTISNRYLSTTPNSSGYLQFAVRVSVNKYKWLTLHRVLSRGYGKLPSLSSPLEVDHDDGNILNNELTNLVVRSAEEHRIKTTLQRGHILGGNRCIGCGTKIHTYRQYCINCSPAKQIINPTISKEEIEYWVQNYSWVRAGKELGLSDNGVRKRYKSLGGDPKSLRKFRG